jgi:SPP1 gp7 family putative phage head morphogenesis protein
MDFLTQPVPHKEAAAYIAGKPAVTRDVFDRLLPEIKARAFTVTGIEDATALQMLRDRIADLPLGGDWDEIKDDLIEGMEPYLGDGAAKRAEMLLRLHGFTAYSAAAWQVMDAQRDVFPYWQYKSMGDGRVRDSHRALDGKIFPADSAFWQTHFPPWEWGCRCQAIPMDEDEVADIRASEAAAPVESRRVIEGEALRQVEQQGRLVEGPNQIHDIRTPTQRGRPGAFEWNPGDLRIPLDALRDRYDADVWSTFEAFARATALAEGLTLWDWLSA